MPSPWRLLDTGPGEAAWNMAVDEALAESVRRGGSPPVLRFYTWDQPAISCGYFQKIDREIDLEACRKKGIAVVRRPTGGRAVFHGTDLTLSVIAQESEPGIGTSVEATYRKIAEAIALGLKGLGIPIDLARSQASGKEILGSASCFASKSRHELVLCGRKAFGCAQRRREGVVLSQGSVQLWGNGGVPPELMRPEGSSSSSGPPVSDQGKRIPTDQAKQGIAEGFRRVFGVGLEPSGLTAEEREVAQGLLPRYPQRMGRAYFGAMPLTESL